MKPLVVGNWKMHGTQSEASVLAREIRKGLKDIKDVDVVLAPPFTSLSAVAEALKGSAIGLAAQNVHSEEEGAFTGEISPKMLRALGCRFVIVGHSERRRLFHESDRAVAEKTLASLRAGLRPILCVGETLQERKRGLTTRVIARQLRTALKGAAKGAIEKIEVAYEPVWAIGTGQNATPDQISRAHRWIQEVVRGPLGRNGARRCRILYGGSVRPENAAQLSEVPEVGGLLIGGASLKAKTFLSICALFCPDMSSE